MDHLRSEVRDQPGQHGETPSLLKIQKISWAWWRVPIVPATREAEAAESLEPGGGACSELRSGHCTPAWVTERDSVSKKKKKKERKKWKAVRRPAFNSKASGFLFAIIKNKINYKRIGFETSLGNRHVGVHL